MHQVRGNAGGRPGFAHGTVFVSHMHYIADLINSLSDKFEMTFKDWSLGRDGNLQKQRCCDGKPISFSRRASVDEDTEQAVSEVDPRRTNQCTSTPPPLSRPSWMKPLVVTKYWSKFSSSTSSTSMTRCLNGLKRSLSSGSRKTERTWVMLASSSCCLRLRVKSLGF